MDQNLQLLHDKMNALSNIDHDTALAMKTANLNGWIASVLRVSGCTLSRERILAMIEGENIREATINDYQMMQCCQALYSEFEYMLGFDTDLNAKLFGRIHQIFSGLPAEASIRDRNFFVDEMLYPAPGPARIPELIRTCELEITSQDHKNDSLEGALRTHNMLIAIWPYTEGSDILAFVCMSYELLKAGYPLPTLDISRKQHLELSSEFTDRGSSSLLKEILIENLIAECEPASSAV